MVDTHNYSSIKIYFCDIITPTKLFKVILLNSAVKWNFIDRWNNKNTRWIDYLFFFCVSKWQMVKWLEFVEVLSAILRDVTSSRLGKVKSSQSWPFTKELPLNLWRSIHFFFIKMSFREATSRTLVHWWLLCFSVQYMHMGWDALGWFCPLVR